MRARPLRPAAVNAALILASLPVLARGADRRTVVWLIAAQQLRFGAAVAHQQVIEQVYTEITDIEDYDLSGRRIAQLLRAGKLAGALEVAETVPWPTGLRGPVSTNLMRLLSGTVYAVVGPSRRSAFLVFSWLGFWGLYLFLRAFVRAVPGGDADTYRRLLFLSPSLGYWTSMIGKEPWTVLTLGCAAHGSARALTGSRLSGIAQAALGATLAAVARAQVAEGRLGMSVGTGIRDAAERSDFGGSKFQPPVGSPPVVAASVLFRPHPLEAHNAQAAAAAAEGTVAALFTLWRGRHAVGALARVWRQPYLAVAAGVTGAMIAYLSRVPNLGMLVRQRTPIIPFVAALLSAGPGRR